MIADHYRAAPEKVVAEVPFSSAWKWSGVTLNGAGRATSYVMGAPDILADAGALQLSPELQATLEEHTAAGRRVVAFGEAAGGLPSDPASQPPPQLTPRALVVLEERLRGDAAETIAFMREQQVDLKLISGDARSTVTAVAYAIGVDRDAGVIEGPQLPDDRAGLGRAAEENTIFCRITPEQKKSLVSALGERGRFTAMIGDGVNDVPALKQARMAVAMGSGSQITKGVADIVLLKDQFSMLPRAVGEGRRIARNIHRLGRLYLTKSVYAAVLIALTSVLGFTFPFLPAAPDHRGVPDDRDPVVRPRARARARARSTAAGSCARWPRSRCRPGSASPSRSMLSFFFVDSLAGGTIEEGRTAATTTLIVLGLCFILLLERGPGREHITIQSYMLAMIAGLGALFAADPRDRARCATSSSSSCSSAGQWFLALLCVAIGLLVAAAGWRLPYVQHLEAPEGEAAGGRRRPGAHPYSADRGLRSRAQRRDDPADIRRTKIVCTIGPATRSVERMCELIEAGADVFRLNFSHGTEAEHAENVAMTREAGERCGKEVGILGDLPGPKLRLGDVEGGLIELPPDGEVELTTDDVVGDPEPAARVVGGPARARCRRAARSIWPTAGSACASRARTRPRRAAGWRSAARWRRTRA